MLNKPISALAIMVATITAAPHHGTGPSWRDHPTAVRLLAACLWVRWTKGSRLKPPAQQKSSDANKHALNRIRLKLLYTRPPCANKDMPNQSTTTPCLYLTPQNSSMFFLASMLVVSATSSTLHFPRCARDTHLRKRMNHACTLSCHPSIIAKPSLCPPSTKNHPNGQGSASYARAQVELVLQGKPRPENLHSGAHLVLEKYVAPSTMQKQCSYIMELLQQVCC